MKNHQLDDYMVQQIISRLILPFEHWDAYKFGIIDRKGKVLKKKNTLKTKNEKDSWSNLDILCCNLKKILMSYPTTQMKLAQLNNIQNANIPTVIGQPPTYPMSLLSNFFLLKEEIVIKDKGRHIEAYAHDGDNKSVGYTRVNKNTNEVEFTTVDREYRRRGIASKLYDAIEKYIGKAVKPSDTQSDDAQEFWKNRNSDLSEDAPANSSGGGGIAAIGVGPFGEPPVRKREKTLISRLNMRRRIQYGNS